MMKLRVNYNAVLDVLEDQLTAAAITGWHRAHKHTDDPTHEQVFEAVAQEIRGVMCDWFPAPESR